MDGLERLPVLLEVPLDLLDDHVGLVLMAVGDQPSGALGDVFPVEDDDQAQDRPDPEAEPPAEVDR